MDRLLTINSVVDWTSMEDGPMVNSSAIRLRTATGPSKKSWIFVATILIINPTSREFTIATQRQNGFSTRKVWRGRRSAVTIVNLHLAIHGNEVRRFCVRRAVRKILKPKMIPYGVIPRILAAYFLMIC